MADYPRPVIFLIEEFSKLPGIGEKTAERLAFHLLKEPEAQARTLADAMLDARTKVHHCRRCFNFAQAELCEVCADDAREQRLVCVVESPRDLVSVERSGIFKGVYHCLLGRLAPLEGVTEDNLTVKALLKRCKSGEVEEVIIATSSDLEGDATAMAVARALEATEVKVSRLARGVPVGYGLELLGANVLEEAFSGRQPMSAGGLASARGDTL